MKTISEITIMEFNSLRINHGWSLKKSAMILGVSRVYLTNVLNRRKAPSESLLKRMFFLLLGYQNGYQKTRLIVPK